MRGVLVSVLAAVLVGCGAPHHHRVKKPCTHGESSIAGKFVGKGKHRRFVITQPAHRTGC